MKFPVFSLHNRGIWGSETGSLVTASSSGESRTNRPRRAPHEGRGWRGFHHHATLCIAAYGFLIAERGALPPSGPSGAALRDTDGRAGISLAASPGCVTDRDQEVEEATPPDSQSQSSA